MTPFRHFMISRESLLGIDYDRWAIGFRTQTISEPESEQLTDFVIHWCETHGLGISCGYSENSDKQMEFDCILYPPEPRKRLAKKYAVRLLAAVKKRGALTGIRATGEVHRWKEPLRTSAAPGAC